VGWAVDNIAVTSVRILVDGNLAATGTLTVNRPDVQANYPWAPLASGASIPLDTTAYTNGTHVITAEARDAAGNSGAQDVTVTISNSGGGGAPTPLSLVSSGPAPTMAATIDYTITFSQPVLGVSASNFGFPVFNATGASVANVTGTGATRTITVNTGHI